jgi:hypothetical protein
MSNVQQVLEQRTARSAQMPRTLLGPIRLKLVTPDVGRPFYRADTTPDALAPVEEPPPAGAEGGSNSLESWRRRALNPRKVSPEARPPYGEPSECRGPATATSKPSTRLHRTVGRFQDGRGAVEVGGVLGRTAPAREVRAGCSL